MLWDVVVGWLGNGGGDGIFEGSEDDGVGGMM